MAFGAGNMKESKRRRQAHGIPVCCVKLGLLVRKFLMHVMTKVAVRLKQPAWHKRLKRVTSKVLLYKVIRSLLQWKDYADLNLKWIGPPEYQNPFNISEWSNGYWLVHPGDAVSIADACAAMLNATTYQSGIAPNNLVAFVQKYARTIPKRLPLKGYTAEDRVAMMATRKRLQAEFMINGATGRRFGFVTKLLRNELGKRRLDLVKLDNTASSVAEKAGAMEETVRESWAVVDSSLGAQKSHASEHLEILREAMNDFISETSESRSFLIQKHTFKKQMKNHRGRSKDRKAGKREAIDLKADDVENKDQTGTTDAQAATGATPAADQQGSATSDGSAAAAATNATGAALTATGTDLNATATSIGSNGEGEDEGPSKDAAYDSSATDAGEDGVSLGDAQGHQERVARLQRIRDELKVAAAMAKSDRFNKLVKMVDEGNDKLQQLALSHRHQSDVAEAVVESIEEYVVPDAKRAVDEAINLGTLSRELLNRVMALTKLPSSMDYQFLQRRYENLNKQLAEMGDSVEEEKRLEGELENALAQCPEARSVVPPDLLAQLGMKGKKQNTNLAMLQNSNTPESRRAAAAMKVPQNLATMNTTVQELMGKVTELWGSGMNDRGKKMATALWEWKKHVQELTSALADLNKGNSMNSFQPTLEIWTSSGESAISTIKALGDSLAYEDLPQELVDVALKEFSFVAPVADKQEKEDPKLAAKRLAKAQAARQRKLETARRKLTALCEEQEIKNQDLRDKVKELNNLVQEAEVEVYHARNSITEAALAARRRASAELLESSLGSLGDNLDKAVPQVDPEVEARKVEEMKEECNDLETEKRHLARFVAKLEDATKLQRKRGAPMSFGKMQDWISQMEAVLNDDVVDQILSAVSAEAAAAREESAQEGRDAAIPEDSAVTEAADSPREVVAEAQMKGGPRQNVTSVKTEGEGQLDPEAFLKAQGLFAIVPPDAKAGDLLHMPAATGLIVQFVLPEGVQAGDLLRIGAGEDVPDAKKSPTSEAGGGSSSAFKVCVPEGAVEGSVLEVLSPTGDVVYVEVPVGSNPGDLIDGNPQSSSKRPESTKSARTPLSRRGTFMHSLVESHQSALDAELPASLGLVDTGPPGSIVQVENNGELVDAVAPQITRLRTSSNASALLGGSMSPEGDTEDGSSTLSLSVKVPEGYKPGDTLTIQSPFGGLIQVVVPEDAVVGSYMSFEVERSNRDMEDSIVLATRLRIDVPDYAQQGSILEVATHNGRIVEVEVPAGAPKGTFLGFVPNAIAPVVPQLSEASKAAFARAAQLKKLALEAERYELERQRRAEFEPWLNMFPRDEDELAKEKYLFCRANKIDAKKLYLGSHQRRLKLKLMRMLKQNRRACALKTKCLMMFLSADERKAFMKEFQSPDDRSKAQHAMKIEHNRLNDRQGLLDRLITFWEHRMATFERETGLRRKNFRKRLYQVLMQTHRLTKSLDSAGAIGVPSFFPSATAQAAMEEARLAETERKLDAETAGSAASITASRRQSAASIPEASSLTLDEQLISIGQAFFDRRMSERSMVSVGSTFSRRVSYVGTPPDKESDDETVVEPHASYRDSRRSGFLISSLPLSGLSPRSSLGPRTAQEKMRQFRGNRGMSTFEGGVGAALLKKILLNMAQLQTVTGISRFVPEAALSDALLLQGRGSSICQHYVQEIMKLEDSNEQTHVTQTLVGIEQTRMVKLMKVSTTSKAAKAGLEAAQKVIRVLERPPDQMVPELAVMGLKDMDEVKLQRMDMMSIKSMMDNKGEATDSLLSPSHRSPKGSKAKAMWGLVGQAFAARKSVAFLDPPIEEEDEDRANKKHDILSKIEAASKNAKLDEDGEQDHEHFDSSLAHAVGNAVLVDKFAKKLRSKRNRRRLKRAGTTTISPSEVLQNRLLSESKLRWALTRFDRHLRKWRIKDTTTLPERPHTARGLLQADAVKSKPREYFQKWALEGKKQFTRRPSLIPPWTESHEVEWAALQHAVREQKERRLQDQHDRAYGDDDDGNNESTAITFAVHKENSRLELRDDHGTQRFVEMHRHSERQSEGQVERLRRQLTQSMNKALHRDRTASGNSDGSPRREFRRARTRTRDTTSGSTEEDLVSSPAGRHTMWRLDQALFDMEEGDDLADNVEVGDSSASSGTMSEGKSNRSENVSPRSTMNLSKSLRRSRGFSRAVSEMSQLSSASANNSDPVLAIGRPRLFSSNQDSSAADEVDTTNSLPKLARSGSISFEPARRMSASHQPTAEDQERLAIGSGIGSTEPSSPTARQRQSLHPKVRRESDLSKWSVPGAAAGGVVSQASPTAEGDTLGSLRDFGSTAFPIRYKNLAKKLVSPAPAIPNTRATKQQGGTFSGLSRGLTSPPPAPFAGNKEPGAVKQYVVNTFSASSLMIGVIGNSKKVFGPGQPGGGANDPSDGYTPVPLGGYRSATSAVFAAADAATAGAGGRRASRRIWKGRGPQTGDLTAINARQMVSARMMSRDRPDLAHKVAQLVALHKKSLREKGKFLERRLGVPVLVALKAAIADDRRLRSELELMLTPDLSKFLKEMLVAMERSFAMPRGGGGGAAAAPSKSLLLESGLTSRALSKQSSAAVPPQQSASQGDHGSQPHGQWKPPAQWTKWLKKVSSFASDPGSDAEDPMPLTSKALRQGATQQDHGRLLHPSDAGLRRNALAAENVTSRLTRQLQEGLGFFFKSSSAPELRGTTDWATQFMTGGRRHWKVHQMTSLRNSSSAGQLRTLEDLQLLLQRRRSTALALPSVLNGNSQDPLRSQISDWRARLRKPSPPRQEASSPNRLASQDPLSARSLQAARPPPMQQQQQQQQQSLQPSQGTTNLSGKMNAAGNGGFVAVQGLPVIFSGPEQKPKRGSVMPINEAVIDVVAAADETVLEEAQIGGESPARGKRARESAASSSSGMRGSLSVAEEPMVRSSSSSSVKMQIMDSSIVEPPKAGWTRGKGSTFEVMKAGEIAAAFADADADAATSSKSPLPGESPASDIQQKGEVTSAGEAGGIQSKREAAPDSQRLEALPAEEPEHSQDKPLEACDQLPGDHLQPCRKTSVDLEVNRPKLTPISAVDRSRPSSSRRGSEGRSTARSVLSSMGSSGYPASPASPASPGSAAMEHDAASGLYFGTEHKLEREEENPKLLLNQYMQDFEATDLDMFLDTLTGGSNTGGAPQKVDPRKVRDSKEPIFSSRAQSASSTIATSQNMQHATTGSSCDIATLDGSTAEAWRKALRSPGPSREARQSPLPSSGGLRPRTVDIRSAMVAALGQEALPIEVIRASTAPWSSRSPKLPVLPGAIPEEARKGRLEAIAAEFDSGPSSRLTSGAASAMSMGMSGGGGGGGGGGGEGGGRSYEGKSFGGDLMEPGGPGASGMGGGGKGRGGGGGVSLPSPRPDTSGSAAAKAKDLWICGSEKPKRRVMTRRQVQATQK